MFKKVELWACYNVKLEKYSEFCIEIEMLVQPIAFWNWQL